MQTVRARAILVLILVGLAAPSWADPFTGIIKQSRGDVVIQRNGEQLAVDLGIQVRPSDVIRTGSRGAVGVIFSDDTRVSMGPDTEIVIEAYQFVPRESRLSFVLRVIRGTVSYLSGQITKLAPGSVQLIVPDATIGTRGTHVLIKVEQD
jgi:hypothetical protein